ncbi:MAG TPA: type II toxin-antitoxin system VapC family toxin [Bacillota bacterium]|nr:type II toxin-antitoxin system VapC family toxin [Bacillota bacterium]
MRFWDSSALVLLCVEQDSSSIARKWYHSDPLLVAWWATPVECASAVARLLREGRLDDPQASAALARVDALSRDWIEVMPTSQLRSRAARLLAVHVLRAADALQLAAALSWTAADPGGVDFVTADAQLERAARLEGFTLWNPHEPPAPS